MGKNVPDPDREPVGSRCRSRPGRPAGLSREDGALRPTDVIGAFFLAGLLFILAGVAVAAVGSTVSWTWTRWLALHLVFVGGVSQLILGASQFFAGAFLATDPPSRALIRIQLGAWNAGAVVFAAAVPTGVDVLTGAAVLALGAGLAAYLRGLRALRRRSLQRRPFATRWYLTGAAFLGAGLAAGTALALGAAWPHGDLLGAHLTLNVAGWFGLAIVGTLHTFYPSLARTQLAHPRLEPWAFWSWSAGVAALAAGYALAVDPLATAGWLGLGLGAALLAANVAACAIAAPRPLLLPARLLGLAQAFLVAGLAVVIASALGDGPGAALAGSTRMAAAALLVLGWIGLTVLGSLLHLLAVVVRVRDLSRPLPAARPGPDAALVAAAGLGTASLALAQLADLEELARPAAIAVVAVYALLLARIIRLAARLVTVARPRV